MKQSFLWGRCMLLLLSFLLTGCGKTTAGSGEESERFTVRSIVFDCCSESGILYEKDGILCFVDYATGKDVVLCTKPNCVHAPYSAVNNPDPYCDAALPWDDVIETMIYGDKLYAFVTNFDSTVVYEKYASESEWKELAEIPYSYYQVVNWIAYNDRIYYVADQFMRPEGTLALEDAIFLSYVDLTDGTYGSLSEPDEEIGIITILFADEKNLYYETDYRLDAAMPENMGQVYRMDLETLKSEPVFQIEENRRFAGMHGEELYYLEDGNLYRTAAGEDRVCLYEGAVSTSGYDVRAASSGFLLQYGLRDEEKFMIVYFDYGSGACKEIERSYTEGAVMDIVGENVLVFGDAVQVIPLTDFLAGKKNVLAQHEIS
ncbi:MAG: hypothetical protein NC409_10830 [Clostridium sp.]|nr:hypothetical protein [Clostridium sp.]